MFAGDSESEFSFDSHDEKSPDRLPGGSKTKRTEIELLTHRITTPEELEFGWSANLSGVRGLTEQQARKILCFERSLMQHLRLNSAGSTGEDDADSALNIFSAQQLEVSSAQTVPVWDHAPPGISLSDSAHIPTQLNVKKLIPVIFKSCRAKDTRNSLNSGVPSARPSHPDYRQLASSRLNNSLRISRSQPSFLSLRGLRKSKSGGSDKFSYPLTRRTISDASSHGSCKIGITNAGTSEKSKAIFVTASISESGLRGLVNKISKALMKPNEGSNLKNTMQENDPILCHLSHDMVGAASPFPMRPPLNLREQSNPTNLDGGWTGYSRSVYSKYSQYIAK